jgi:hypothetical protein
MDENAWVVIRAEGRRPLILHAVPIAPHAASGPHTVVILIDLAGARQPSPEALQKIFGLTPAEARLAIEIARGRSPDEIAEAAGRGRDGAQAARVRVRQDRHAPAVRAGRPPRPRLDPALT